MISIDDFRQWALPKDVRSPRVRGLLAEYLVRRAVGEDAQPAEDWHYVDIECRNNGPKIEVKSAAYLQPYKDNGWKEIKNPKFSIAQKKNAWCNWTWDWKTSTHPKRWADIYVLCLEGEKEKDKYEPLDPAQWKFFVITTAQIDNLFGAQKSVAVGRLCAKGLKAVTYDRLQEKINDIWDNRYRRIPS